MIHHIPFIRERVVDHEMPIIHFIETNMIYETKREVDLPFKRNLLI